MITLLKTHTKSAVISIEQPPLLRSPSPPPFVPSPISSSVLYNEDKMSNTDFLFDNPHTALSGNGEYQKLTNMGGGRALGGPKDERLSIVVSPHKEILRQNSSLVVPADDHHQITIETSLSSPGSADVMVDRSFADISNADYLESCNEQGLSDEFYPTDLF